MIRKLPILNIASGTLNKTAIDEKPCESWSEEPICHPTIIKSTAGDVSGWPGD
jgi:hypothetical protein